MAVNQVIYDGETLIDLTNDTVTPETLAYGATAHDASGATITGTMLTSEVLFDPTDATTGENKGDNTSEAIDLTTSDDLINYSRLDIIYGLSWNTTNIATIIPALNNAVALSVTYASKTFMSTTTGMCRLDLDNKKLTRGNNIKDTGTDGINRERLIKTDYGSEEGTISITSTLYTAETGFGIYIYRVIGYK